MSYDHGAPPVNPIPTLVWGLFVAMALPELLFSLGERGLAGGPAAIGWRIATIERLAFSGELFDWMLQTRRFAPEHLARLVAYPFVSGALLSTVFAAVMLLALGKMVAEAIGQGRLLAIFLGSAVGGALVYWAVLATAVPLYGGFAPVYGLIGAFTYLLWVRLGQAGEAQMRAFGLIGVLMGIQLLFGLLYGANPHWVAEVGGFVCGFGLTVVLVPGGAARLLSRIRR